jgi:OmpA-OmpF porin, OOP family
MSPKRCPARSARLRLAALFVACMAPACAREDRLDRELARIAQSLVNADEAGAMRCAPRQLAIARSHLEFAELEREQGFTSRAEYHLRVADQHARAAKLLAPREHCAAPPAGSPQRAN